MLDERHTLLQRIRLKLSDRNFVRRQLREVALILLLSLPTSYFMCRSCYLQFDTMVQIMALSAAMWVTLWKGNEYLSNITNHYISWVEHPAKRLVVGLAGMVIYTFLALALINLVFAYLIGFNTGFFTPQGFWITSLISILITSLISLFLHSRSFLLSWRQAAINAERLKMEQVQARYEHLKNQINPHFLFNSFNALNDLIYQDADLAARYVGQLSEVFRYVLNNSERGQVSLSEELEALKSYVFLQQIRFGENLRVTVSAERAGRWSILPLALQMLVENAIKHNVISREEPLEILIDLEDGWLQVRNRLQKKNLPLKERTGIGLENIQARCLMHTGKPAIILEENGYFAVRIPLIESKEYENSDR